MPALPPPHPVLTTNLKATENVKKGTRRLSNNTLLWNLCGGQEKMHCALQNYPRNSKQVS